ncbi:MAG: hypothetical protein WAQ05_21880 [Rubrivivax sp.]
MTIWTIYNHGTNASSLKGPDSGEIVNLFGNNDRRPLMKGKIVTEGVGSIGAPHDIVQSFSRDAKSGVYTRTVESTPAKKATAYHGATGVGVQQNVDSTVELIRALNLAGHKPEAINMLGWSRGAVTCIRIAWKLWQSQDANIRNIPINIFAVDPVAGFGHNSEVDATTLTPNVKQYLATLATGEKRRFFKPIAGNRLTVVDPTETKTWVLPMPGHHSDTAMNDNPTGRVVFNLAYRFLNAVNTPVPAMRHYMLDPVATWKHYETTMVDSSSVHTTKTKQSLAMGGKAYSRAGEAQAQGFGEQFFPNVHARRVFEAAYPVHYEAYFGANSRQRNTMPWGVKYSPRLVAESKRNGMSQGMIDKLAALPQGDLPVPAVPPHVDLMIGALTLV